MGERTCSKPGCGALNLIGEPCNDWDCPQQIVSPQEYRDALAAKEALIAKLEKALADWQKAFPGYALGGQHDQ